MLFMEQSKGTPPFESYPPPQVPYNMGSGGYFPGAGIECKKTTAGILALLLGGLGVHKFYLGYTSAGILQILLTVLTCGAGSVVALVEGIVYLTKNDQEFVQTYQVGKKPWL